MPPNRKIYSLCLFVGISVMRKTLDKLYGKKKGFILLLGSRFVTTDNVPFLVPKLTTKSTR